MHLKGALSGLDRHEDPLSEVSEHGNILLSPTTTTTSDLIQDQDQFCVIYCLRMVTQS